MNKPLLPLIAACLLLATACQAQPPASPPVPPQSTAAQVAPTSAPTPRIQLPASGKKPRIQCVRWPCPDSPMDSPTGHVVQKLYRQYPVFYADPEPARELLSEGLFALLQKDAACASEHGMCAIGADPWIAAQDGDRTDPLEYRQLSREKDTAGNEVAATVELCFRYVLDPQASERRCAELKLTRQPDTAWKVDDLISPDGQSLRDTLQSHAYE